MRISAAAFDALAKAGEKSAAESRLEDLLGRISSAMDGLKAQTESALSEARAAKASAMRAAKDAEAAAELAHEAKSAPAPTYLFDVARGPDGLITSITAKPD